MDAEQEIRRRIGERDSITFAEFMDLALFWPRGGYYTARDNVGPQGDFYTAPSAHPAFGALLCLQVFQMWQLLGKPPTFWVVEPGAGGGVLCHDLMEYAAHFPATFRRSLRYLSVDLRPIPGLEARLPTELRAGVDRVAASGVPMKGVAGCFLANEVVDSMPVHRVVVEEGALKEVYVTLEGEELAEVVGPPSTPALEGRLSSLGIALPEGHTAEINLALDPWLAQISSALDRGFLLTIDYGHPARELYSSRRRRGTLTCYYSHVQTDSPYQRIGRQDITAQVDFTSLEDAGLGHGLDPLGFTTQGQFLHNLGLGSLLARLPGSLPQRQRDANRMGMLEIARPGGMGDFRVLAQGKGVGIAPLWGFQPFSESGDALQGLPAPLLGGRHTPVMEGRYPHLDIPWEDLLR